MQTLFSTPVPTIFIGQRGLRIVEAAVNAAPQVFGEAAENVPVNAAQGAIQINFDLIHQKISADLSRLGPVGNH